MIGFYLSKCSRDLFYEESSLCDINEIEKSEVER